MPSAAQHVVATALRAAWSRGWRMFGPTVPGGRVPMRFGPLGSEGGERRLNVLISRAKQRCEVFSSMTDEDIDPDFAQSRKGVFAFQMFLHFARTGSLAMGEATGRDHDSVFEEQVAKALHERGYHVHRQVGLAGFFIDLAYQQQCNIHQLQEIGRLAAPLPPLRPPRRPLRRPL